MCGSGELAGLAVAVEIAGHDRLDALRSNSETLERAPAGTCRIAQVEIEFAKVGSEPRKVIAMAKLFANIDCVLVRGECSLVVTRSLGQDPEMLVANRKEAIFTIRDTIQTSPLEGVDIIKSVA